MRASNLLDAASSSTYTVRIPTPLKQAFDEVASLQERNGSQLVREFMRDYVQANAKQASDHQQWFAQQVQTTRQALKAGKQSSIPAAKVNAWLDNWGTDAELPAPTQPAAQNTKSIAGRKRAGASFSSSGRNGRLDFGYVLRLAHARSAHERTGRPSNAPANDRDLQCGLGELCGNGLFYRRSIGPKAWVEEHILDTNRIAPNPTGVAPGNGENPACVHSGQR